MDKSGFCVFLVKDNVENFSDILKNKKLEYSLDVCKLSDLPDVVSSVRTSENFKNINLVLISKDIVNEDQIKNINLIFTEKYKLRKPHFLFISKIALSAEELDQISNAQNYFYLLPDKELPNMEVITLNLLMMINFIYHKIVNIERLNEYIINSFQTIVDSAIITRQKAEIEELNEKLHAMSMTDFLTKVLNRRAFFEKMEEEKTRTMRDYWRIANVKNGEVGKAEVPSNIQQAIKELPLKEDEKPIGKLMEHYGRFTCVLMDIDHFKNINDTYGHLTGDEVLRAMGEVLASKDIFRENDILARYGGEEFVVLLPETSRQHARIPAERFREKMKSIIFYDEHNNPFNVTVSLGISEFRITDKDNEELINRADQALYYAKEHGRDQVVIFEDVFVDENN